MGLLLLFALKDGLGGKSPGKYLLGLSVVKQRGLEPIGPTESMIRNLPILMLLSLATVAPSWWPAVKGSGNVICLLGLAALDSEMLKGPRSGDRWAGTLVVWDEHKHRPPFDQRGIHCLHCGYNLTGNVSGICPECGHRIPPWIETGGENLDSSTQDE